MFRMDGFIFYGFFTHRIEFCVERQNSSFFGWDFEYSFKLACQR